MRPSLRRYLPVVPCLLLTVSPVRAGEVFLIGAVRSGSYGAETDSESREARLVWVAGDRFQFRADVAFLEVESSSGIRPGPGGPIPGRPGQGHGPGGANDGGSGNGDSGNGGSGGGGSGGGGTGGGGSSGAVRSLAAERSPPAPTPDELAPISASGLGDTYLAVSHILAGGGAALYRFDGGLSVKAPTASSEEGLGTGEWDLRIGLTGEYRFWSATAFAGAGWNHYGDPDWGELRDGPDGWIGVETEPLAERVVLSTWLEANTEVVEGVGSRAAVGFGMRTTGRIRWRILGTVGLTDAAEDFGIVFGVSTGVQTPTV
jgi:hypothetical protein